MKIILIPVNYGLLIGDQLKTSCNLRLRTCPSRAGLFNQNLLRHPPLTSSKFAKHSQASLPKGITRLNMAPPLRVLCLHGWRTNAAVLRMQTQALQRAFGPRAEFFFLDAPHAASGPAAELVRAMYAKQAPYFQWWDANKRPLADGSGSAWVYDGVELSLDYLVGQVHALGTVDVVLGFSQGAAATTMLTAHYQKVYGRVPWRVCLLVCGFLPRTAATKHLFQDAVGTPRPLDVASVHVIGQADDLAPQSETLFDHFSKATNRATKFVHEEGHRFPSPLKHREMYTEIVGAVVEMATSPNAAARF